MLARTRREDLEFKLILQAKQEELNILMLLQKGIIDPRTLSDSLIETIRNDIKIHSHFEIPIPKEHFRTEELIKISQIDAIIINNTVVLSLTILLVDKNIFTFYKLHSLPVAQHINKQNFTTSIIPTHSFLAIDRQNNLFHKFNTLHNCIETHYEYICNPSEPIYTTSAADCEMSLMLNPHTSIPETCSIQFDMSRKNMWLYLEYEAAWLFSLQAQINAVLICPGKVEQSITLENSGIITIERDCALQTQS